MLTWSWYRFQEHLKHKVREFPWCRLVLGSEAYTSKTCSDCGSIHHKMNGDKEFKCLMCPNQCDRDWQAARNGILHFLTEWAPPPTSTREAIT